MPSPSTRNLYFRWPRRQVPVALPQIRLSLTVNRNSFCASGNFFAAAALDPVHDAVPPHWDRRRAAFGKLPPLPRSSRQPCRVQPDRAAQRDRPKPAWKHPAAQQWLLRVCLPLPAPFQLDSRSGMFDAPPPASANTPPPGKPAPSHYNWPAR